MTLRDAMTEAGVRAGMTREATMLNHAKAERVGIGVGEVQSPVIPGHEEALVLGLVPVVGAIIEKKNLGWAMAEFAKLCDEHVNFAPKNN